MSGMLGKLVFVSACWMFLQVQAGTQPYCNCIELPKYVTPKDNVACNCSYVSYQKSWSLQCRGEHGHVLAKNTSGTEGQTLTLSLPAKELVVKAESGQPYARVNCSVYDEEGVSEILLHSYVPHVAYGPYNTTLTSPKQYVQPGDSKMTLTCSARSNPAPLFRWPDEAVRLRNCTCNDGTVGETVTLDTGLFSDGDVISCAVTNDGFDPPETTLVNFTVRYEPTKPSDHVGQRDFVAEGTLGALLALAMLALVGQYLWWKRRMRNLHRVQGRQRRQRNYRPIRGLCHVGNPSNSESSSDD